MSAAPTARRQPTQERAKARVERILAAASELIAETGSDTVRMTEVAARAGIPIGSLYQYFPDKAAILRLLAMRFMERVREGLHVGLQGIDSGDEALARIDSILENYYATFLNEPVVRDVWSGTQSDKALQALDIEDSRENGQLVFNALKPLVRKRDHARFEAACFLLMQLSGAAVRLAIAVERKEGDRLIAEYRRMMRSELRTFLGGDGA
ncbi:MAG: TetR/AcrR family transcriptional regulator [Parvibaculum sp.]|uniref:TetR family transcriptional regulator n=1 Tax=Parvibaculum sp. TaxID=2024848 RepID=UPI003C75269E